MNKIRILIHNSSFDPVLFTLYNLQEFYLDHRHAQHKSKRAVIVLERQRGLPEVKEESNKKPWGHTLNIIC